MPNLQPKGHILQGGGLAIKVQVQKFTFNLIGGNDFLLHTALYTRLDNTTAKENFRSEGGPHKQV